MAASDPLGNLEARNQFEAFIKAGLTPGNARLKRPRIPKARILPHPLQGGVPDQYSKGLQAASYADLEAFGLNPVSEPPWSGALLGPVTDQNKAARLRMLFEKNPLTGQPVTENDILEDVMGLSKWVPMAGTEAERKERAVKHVMARMGELFNPETWEGTAPALLSDEATGVDSLHMQQFLSTVPEDTRKGWGTAKKIQEYYRNSLFMYDKETGIISKAAKEVARLAEVSPTDQNVKGITEQLMNLIHTGKGVKAQTWLERAFATARTGNNTIIWHNMDFDSRMLAGRMDEQFWNDNIKSNLHSYSNMKSDIDGLHNYRLYQTSSKVTGAKFKASKNYAEKHFNEMFNAWNEHLIEKTEKIKMLDTLDLARAVFGMAQTSKERKGLERWKLTKSHFGSDLQSYKEALGAYASGSGKEMISKEVMDEFHLAPADTILHQSFAHDLQQMGFAIQQGRADSMDDRLKTVFNWLADNNNDSTKRLRKFRNQVMGDAVKIGSEGAVTINPRAVDPKTGQRTTGETFIKSREWVERRRKYRDIILPANKYDRKRTEDVEEMFQSHLDAVPEAYRKNWDKKALEAMRQGTHDVSREAKQSLHTGKIAELKKVVEKASLAGDNSVGTDHILGAIRNQQTSHVVETVAKEMGHSGKIGMMAIGGLGGAIAMKLGMGNEADKYINSMSEHGERQRSSWDYVSIPASLGVTAYGGYTIMRNARLAEKESLVKFATSLTKISTKNLGAHLIPMTAGAAFLSGAMYAATSNVSDVVDADPSGGHPFKIGAAMISMAGATTLAYGARYGFPEMDAVAKKPVKDRFVDRLAKVISPWELSATDSGALSSRQKVKLKRGEHLNPTLNKALERATSILDVHATKIKDATTKAGFKEMLTAMGKWKVAGMVVGGVAAGMAVDRLMAPADRVIPAEEIPDRYAESAAIGEYGFSKEMHDTYTPFGSRLDAPKALRDGVNISRHIAPKTAKRGVLPMTTTFAQETSTDLRINTNQARQALKGSGKTSASPRLGDIYHDGMRKTLWPQEPAIADNLAKPRATVTEHNIANLRGIRTEPEVPEGARAHPIMHKRSDGTALILQNGTKVKKPIPNPDMSSSGARTQVRPHMTQKNSIQRVTAGHADTQIDGQHVQRVSAILDDGRSRMKDIVNGQPKTNTVRVSETSLLPKKVSSGIMRSRDHIVAADMIKCDPFGSRWQGAINRPNGRPTRKRRPSYALYGAA